MNRYKYFDGEGKRHLHTLDEKPLFGTSTVLSIVSKDLTWWAVGEGLKMLGWTPSLEYINGKPRTVAKERRIKAVDGFIAEHMAEIVAMWEDSDDDDTTAAESYLTLLDMAYKAHSNKTKEAAAGGTDLHARLEKYVKACIEKHDGAPFVGNSDDKMIKSFMEWAAKNVRKFLWSELHTYSEEHWLGGITDAGAEMTDGRTAIIDFKSSKRAYNNHFWQIGGYQIQVEENGGFTSSGEQIIKPCKVDTHIIIPFGAPEFSPEIKHDEKGVHKQAFLAALTLYKINQQTE